MTLSIPKRIMQTWKDNDVPDRWKSSPKSIQNHMSEWRYKLMTDKDNREFVQRYFPDFLGTYDAFPHPIQRADAIRYMYLYIKGGIYMDLDYEVQRPLDDLFESSSDLYFVESGNVGSYITNSFMACKPRHPIWLSVIEEMKKGHPKWSIIKHFQVMETTGPMMLTRVVRNGPWTYHMLPRSLLTPCSVCNISCETSDDIYLKQLPGSSWLSWDSYFLIGIMCGWKGILKGLGVILLALFVILIFALLVLYL